MISSREEEEEGESSNYHNRGKGEMEGSIFGKHLLRRGEMDGRDGDGDGEGESLLLSQLTCHNIVGRSSSHTRDEKLVKLVAYQKLGW